MLSSLQIRNILLIKQLSINFTSGLNVFTGETGAGKSILLDCIGFVLGFRGPSKFVRHGSKQGEVVAIFDLPTHHDAWEILSEAGIESIDNELIIKRINHQDGKKIAFINDQRCSTQILVKLSKKVIEIQGQNQDSELLTDNGPRELIDNFADLRTEVLNIRNVWNTLLDEKTNLMKISKEAEEIKKDEDYLTHAINELKEFQPQVGEDVILENKRRLMKSAEKIKYDLQKAYETLEQGCVEKNIDTSLGWLSKLNMDLDYQLKATVDLLENSSKNVTQVLSNISDILSQLELEKDNVQEIEERLFLIKELSRKYKVVPDDLGKHSEELSENLLKLESFQGSIDELEKRIHRLEQKYNELAKDLSIKRIEAAKKLDYDMERQLPALKLDQATFKTTIEKVKSGVSGQDKVRFDVSTNPGTPLGPVGKIASGGEQSRFLLGLKVALADLNTGLTLIFDEIDSGVGGATADAVGKRLRALAVGTQILVVTHSPQVASLGNHHIKVVKFLRNSVNEVGVSELNPIERTEEISRMLSGGVVTPEARLAADVLLRG